VFIDWVQGHAAALQAFFHAQNLRVFAVQGSGVLDG
jgi:hypothetical protein